jgi:hypothetical protein
MAYVRKGFLVERFGGGVERRARLIEVQPPEGTVKFQGATRIGGKRYVVAFHFPPGIKQGRAVAWPQEGI